MEQTFPMKIIATIHTDFPSKFGIPRQSGLAASTEGVIRFLPEYRSADALRGIEGFSRLWLIWEFSAAVRETWSPTVRPPRLGGNERLGVFATRSPFRPNPIGLSCVELDRVEFDPEYGPQLIVRGADLMDGTPIFDIKPYLPYADSFPGAKGGFTDSAGEFLLKVDFPPALLALLPAQKRAGLTEVLSHDPRPSYQNDPERSYGMSFAGFNIRFRVNGDTLTVTEVSEE